MKPFRVAILYGSQTGNAQSIAESVHDVCKQKGVESTLLACDGWKKMKPELAEWSAVVFVVSTTGNGDAPENTEKFWRFLKRRTQPKDLLAGLRFALLGLGDTNYDKFCYMGKSFDKRLRELGATQFHAPAFADEATNMADTVEPWLSSLHPSLLALQRGSSGLIALPGEVAGDGTDDAFSGSAFEVRTAATDNHREKSRENNGAGQDKGGQDSKRVTIKGRDHNGNDENSSLSLLSLIEKQTKWADDTAAVIADADADADATTGQSGMIGRNCSIGDLANATCSTVNGAASAERTDKSERENDQRGVRERNAGNQHLAAVAPLVFETVTNSVQSKISQPSTSEDAITKSGVVETPPSVAKREGDAMDVEATPQAEETGTLPSHRIAVLFGSQTGNAKSIAERIHEGCKERRLDSTLNTCDAWKQMKPELKQWTALVLVVATTGNGDAPENMERFWRFIKRRTQPKDLLEGLPFTVLGLGDTNYDKFCWIGKSLEKRLRELGAVPFYRAAFADEATTMEETVEPWVDSLYSSIRAVIMGSRTVEYNEGVGLAQTTEAKTPPVSAARLTSSNRNGATAVGAVSRGVASAVALTALARTGDDESLVASYGKPSALAETGNEAGVADNTAATSSLSVSPDTPPGNASPTAEKSGKERDGCVDGAVSSAVGPSESSSGSNQSREGISEEGGVVLSPETTAPVPLEAASAAAEAAAAAAAAGMSASWSPSKESGTLPLSRFLDTEHIAPGYSPPRDDVPKLRPRAPDIHFYNLEVVNGQSSAGGGSGDAWLMRAVHRSSSVDSGHTCDWPFEASVLAARYLTEGGRQGDRRVILLELSLKDSGITYEPGDVIGIRCPNPTSDAEYVLERLQVTLPAGAGPDEPFQHSLRSLPSPCTLRDALLTRLDVRAALRKPVIRALAEFCKDERERAWMELLCAKTCGASIYAKFVSAQSLTLCELLEAFPSCTPSAGALLSLLPPLPPRYYSVASSQLATPSSLAIAFSVVSYSLPASTRDTGEDMGIGKQREEGKETGCVIRRRGLCTNWLEKILTPYLQKRGGATGGGGCGADATTGFTVNGRHFGRIGEEGTDVSIPVFVKPTKEFLLPASSKWPCVLIGPGTGVAPFVGFLKHREEQFARRRQTVDAVCSGTWRGGYEISLKGEEDEAQAYRGREGRGDMWLFFGCRHKDQDWIFRKEMEEFLSKGTLFRLSTAFSRDRPKKFHVQDRILESGAELFRLILKEGAYVFVCGDGNAMAHGVHQALVKVLVEHGGGVVGGEEGAEAMLKAMKARNRYVLDVWS